ncbi:methionine ABC transporter substrate-binding protein [Corynebacterium incognita]|uniref:Methionine ABC transporter substrate-binding protein n=1 Tax=Corynebacterium incognita TaxID=2754725 RepID=A0A7G7CN24_9CORY|nr:MetQ/NlpA family ABC transporter substrate-binding protein [Corynebacterium incognita]QNE88990.1 methionine ABC transporter substrate-binding protein [Corynebacterium incognita]
MKRLALVLAAALALSGCSTSSDNDGVVTIGTTDAALPEWEVLKKLAAEEGIKVKMQAFAEYNTPNQALAEGKTDTNKFQHLKFLAEYNAGNGTNLVPLASTQIYPMPLFWKDHDSLDGIEGQSVAIPNDATNQGRAINLLAAHGLLKLKEEGKTTPTPADIDEAASKVKVTPVDAAQTPSAYGEGSPAVITNSFFKRANIDPNTAIVDDEGKANTDPYINVWAVREEDATNEQVKKLAELYLSDEVKAAVQETTGGTTVFVDKPQEELQKILDQLEEEAKK